MPYSERTMRVFSDHAVARYCERVRPSLDKARALEELLRVTRHANTSLEPPAWVSPTDPADVWLILGDVCFPLRRVTATTEVATTCLARGTLTPGARRARSQRRAGRTYARVHKPRDTPRPEVAA